MKYKFIEMNWLKELKDARKLKVKDQIRLVNFDFFLIENFKTYLKDPDLFAACQSLYDG